MAYDQRVAYQAPQRPYNPEQRQQHAPVQQRGYDQSYDDRRAYQDQGYQDQGYQDQGYQDQGHHNQRHYDQGYHEQAPQRERYGDRGNASLPAPPYATPRMRSDPSTNRGPPHTYARGHDNRDQMYNNREPRQIYQQPQYANSMPHQAMRGPQSPSMHGPQSPAFRGPQSPPPHGPLSPHMHAPQMRDPPRRDGQPRQRERQPPIDRTQSDTQYDMRMQKSRRPLIEPVSPTDLPQDNAFPTFPVAKKQPSKQQLNSGPPPKHERPATSNSEHRGERPGNAQQRSPPQMHGRMEPPRGPPRQNSYDSQEHHGRREPQQSHMRPHMPQQQSSDSHYDQREPPNGQIRPSPQHQQSSESQRQMNMPIRPGTAPNGHRGPGMNGHTHPQGAMHVKHNSQSEIYANYYGNDLGAPHAAPRTRDEEIERDMPDFDGHGNTVDDRFTPTHESPPSMIPQTLTPQAQYHNQPQTHAPTQMRSTPGPGQQRQPNGNPYAPAPPAGLGPGPGPHPANQPPQPYQNQYASRDPYANTMQALAMPATNGYGPRPQPQRPGTADAYGRAPLDRDLSNGSLHSQPGRAPSAPPMQGRASPHMRNQNNSPNIVPQHASPMMSGGMAQGPNGMPPTPSSMSSNPDALPHHPAPFRPGLDRPQSGQSSMSAASSQRHIASGPGQPLNIVPSPMTRGGGGPTSPLSPADSRRHSAQGPVTQAEINHLQSMVNAHPQDFATALLLAKRLVEASNVLASENGRLDARQTSKNRERYIHDAHRRVKKLVGAGYPDAIFYLADCHGAGLLGLEEDPKEAFALYQQAAKLGHAAAAYRTAVCCEIGPEEGGGTRRDVVKAVQWYRRAAQLQDVPAMYKLGIICLKGLLSQQKNIPEAERWLKRAADKADRDNPHALHELALLHEPDNPDREVRAKVVGDEKYSRELFFKAAELGWKGSQCRLGQAFEYGALGLSVDARSSIAWYSKAAAQGDHQAELALSGWYLTGAEGILENSDQEAYLWARKAASADPPLAKAMFAMGYYTETGIGCPANLDEAKRWYGRAASYKFPKAIDRLEEIRKNGGKMPKEQKGNRLHRNKDMKGAIR